MPLTFTITDAEDGSGGTATISGTSLTSVNSLYRSLWDGTVQQYAWTLTGNRMGDGIISIVSPGVPLGLYLWQVVRTEGTTTEVGPTYYSPLSNATTTGIHDGILEAAKTRIASLSLAGIGPIRTLKRWFPRVWEGVDDTPTCFVAPPGKEQMLGVLCNKDDVGYPVVVCFVDRIKQDPVLNMGRDLLWRERVSKAFREQRLPGAPLVFRCNVEPDAIVDPTAFEAGYLCSVMVLRFVTRETRGLT